MGAAAAIAAAAVKQPHCRGRCLLSDNETLSSIPPTKYFNSTSDHNKKSNLTLLAFDASPNPTAADSNYPSSYYPVITYAPTGSAIPTETSYTTITPYTTMTLGSGNSTADDSDVGPSPLDTLFDSSDDNPINDPENSTDPAQPNNSSDLAPPPNSTALGSYPTPSSYPIPTPTWSTAPPGQEDPNYPSGPSSSDSEGYLGSSNSTSNSSTSTSPIYEGGYPLPDHVNSSASDANDTSSEGQNQIPDGDEAEGEEINGVPTVANSTSNSSPSGFNGDADGPDTPPDNSTDPQNPQYAIFNSTSPDYTDLLTCPCNCTYVSASCCLSDSGIVYESPSLQVHVAPIPDDDPICCDARSGMFLWRASGECREEVVNGSPTNFVGLGQRVWNGSVVFGGGEGVGFPDGEGEVAPGGTGGDGGG